MTEPSLTILPETADDAVPIERLHERTFGPGRYAKSAYRLREGMGHQLDLSFTARIGTLLVGSVRLSPIRIGESKALLLGPLTVEPPFRDEPYYGKSGFKRIAKGRATMPGPVDPARLLVCELVDGAFEGVSGPIRPDWTAG